MRMKMMIFNNKAINFKKIYQSANEYLVTSKAIKEFPFKARDFVAEQSDIKIVSFDKARRKHNISIEYFGSESAIIFEQLGAYIIFYNQDEPKYRVRFSIIHEFAHYIFGHKMNLESDDSLYSKQELEANCFAAQILMPEQILRECTKRGKILTADFIQKSFGVSKESAEKRLHTLAKSHFDWRSREEKEFDDIIVQKYSSILNKIAPQKVNFYDFDYDMQQERNSWLAVR